MQNAAVFFFLLATRKPESYVCLFFSRFLDAREAKGELFLILHVADREPLALCIYLQ